MITILAKVREYNAYLPFNSKFIPQNSWKERSHTPVKNTPIRPTRNQNPDPTRKYYFKCFPTPDRCQSGPVRGNLGFRVAKQGFTLLISINIKVLIPFPLEIVTTQCCHLPQQQQRNEWSNLTAWTFHPISVSWSNKIKSKWLPE